jgi:cobalt-zinc-cadmium efflux system membrane fusion protein
VSAATILLVEDDEVLRQVLRRVLSRAGYNVVEAGTAAQAQQAARDQSITLGLFDLHLPDGDGMSLTRELRDQGVTFPIVLMTAYPILLHRHPELATCFSHVLTKPLNIRELYQAIESTLASATRPPLTSPTAVQVGAPATLHSVDRESHLVALPTSKPLEKPEEVGPPSCHGLLIGIVLAVAVWFTTLKYPREALEIFKPTADAAASVPLSIGGKAVEGDDNGLELSPEAAKQLQIAVAPVRKADRTRALLLYGSINYDPEHMARARPRFRGEIAEIATVQETGKSGRAEKRALSVGDHVEKGQLLAVLWCKDLGVQKAALAEALNMLWTDEEVFQRFKDHVATGGDATETVRRQEAVVRSDRSAVLTTERTMESWKLSKEEIEAVYTEAKLIYELRQKGDYGKSKEVGKDWARVEVRASINGTIVEKYVTLGDIVDPRAAPDLFKVADLTRLAVIARVYEDDLRVLQALPRPIPWTVRTTDGSDAQVKSAFFEKLSATIDPIQHTALAIGRVDNCDGRLKSGQFVEATVQLVVPKDTVAIPIFALVEDNDESSVFVQPDSTRPCYSMRRVLIAQRIGQLAYIRASLTEPERKSGFQELKVGELAVTKRALELKALLEVVQEKARTRKETTR